MLRFAGEAVSVDVSVADIRRARRRPGAPILQVSYGADQILFIYFVEPPPLPGTVPRRGPGARTKQRLSALKQLRAANRRLKEQIDGWSEAIREVAGR
ncbi:MAG TPA: hypothetical protein VG602_06075 [Actinomycetota bacterium]|nr:hypothetical protein [Actinomycetota bacterium]